MLYSRFQLQSPERIAAVEPGRSLTYRQLDRAASAAASTLRARGAGPEKLVAIVGSRGIDFLITILGAVRAGAAWLPLDPHAPPERQRRLLESARPDDVIDLNEPPAWVGELPVEPLKPHHLAYVMFTSGSTGLPKAAMIEHGGMENHLDAKIQALGLTSEDRVAHTAPPTFDISVWQFLAALAVGGRVEFIPDADLPDVLRVVAERECSILEVVPSLLRLLLEREALPLPRLRWLIPTGEALTPELARRWLRRYPTIPMLNAYGPTECSDDVTHAVIDREPPPGTTVMPIGLPIPGVRLSLLDGELHVGGVAVGRGYRHDPERTAQAFVPDPEQPGMRLYRTGDLARQRPDGAWEYLGRRDHQVKLHGIRVELGEIEALLAEHPAVRQAAAALFQERLVVYFAGELAPEELKRFAAARLPASLVPTQLIALPALPLTPNGKLDRQALPAPPEIPADEAVAEDLLEQGLMNLFQELTGHPVGATDDFFELGGDSLKAIELVVHVEQHYGKSLAPAVLAEDSTPRRLAARLREGGEAWPTVVRLQPGEGVPLLLVPGAGGSVVYLRPLARRLSLPVLGLTPPGLDGVTEPFSSVAQLARHLVSAVREVCPRGPYRLAGHSLGAWTAYEMACLLGEEVQALAVLDMPARVWGMDDRWMPRVLKDLTRHIFGEEVEVSGTPDEQLEQLTSRLEESHLRGLTRMFRAEHAMEHRPEGHFPGTLHLLRTDHFSPLGPQWGWEKRAARVVVRFIPGDHMSLTADPEVAAILDEIMRAPA